MKWAGCCSDESPALLAGEAGGFASSVIINSTILTQRCGAEAVCQLQTLPLMCWLRLELVCF